MDHDRSLSAPASSRSGHPAPITLVVADSQELNRVALVTLLSAQADFSVLGHAGTPDDAIRLCAELRPRVLVLDTNVQLCDCVSPIPRVHEAAPGTVVLAISPNNEGRCLVLHPPRPNGNMAGLRKPCLTATDCLALSVLQGALGAFRRDAAPEGLFAAIRAVAAGESSYDRLTTALVLEQARRLHGGERGGSLTAREAEVASLVAGGHSNKEIADRLGIGEATAKKHLTRVVAKLGVQDRLQVGLYLTLNPQVLAAPPRG